MAVARLKDTGYLKSTSEVAHQMKNKKDVLKKSYDEKKEVMGVHKPAPKNAIDWKRVVDEHMRKKEEKILELGDAYDYH